MPKILKPDLLAMVYIMRKKKIIPFHQLHLPVVPVVRARSAERKRAHACYINEKNSVDGQNPAPPHQCTPQGQRRARPWVHTRATQELHRSYRRSSFNRIKTTFLRWERGQFASHSLVALQSSFGRWRGPIKLLGEETKPCSNRNVQVSDLHQRCH